MAAYSMLIFDLDGTLINSLGDITWSLNRTLEQYGLARFTEELVKTFIGNGSRVLVEKAYAAASGSAGPSFLLDEMHRYYLEIYKKNLVRTTVCYDGVIELLTETKQSGLRNIILTNKPADFSTEVTRVLGLSSLVEEVIGPDSYGIRKPDPGVVNLLLERYGISREKTLFIGDSGVDIETALNARITSAVLTYGFGSTRDFTRADFMLDRFSDLKHVIDLD